MATHRNVGKRKGPEEAPYGASSGGRSKLRHSSTRRFTPAEKKGYSGVCWSVAALGSGCPGTGAFVPHLAMDGCPMAGAQVALNLTKGLGGSWAVVLISLGRASVPLGYRCTLLVQSTPLSLILPLGGSGPGGGSVTLSTVVPPAVPPGAAYLQAFVADVASPIGMSATSGVKLGIW